MNTGTLVTSLIMAAVVAVLIAFLIRQMMRGWLRRAQRQAQLIGTLPSLPDTVGPALIPATKGLYVGSTLAPSWLDRIAVGDLGYRAKAVLTRYPEGIMLQRTGAEPDLDTRRRDRRDPHREGHRGQGDDPRRHPGHPVAVAVGRRNRHRVSRRRSPGVRALVEEAA